MENRGIGVGPRSSLAENRRFRILLEITGDIAEMLAKERVKITTFLRSASLYCK
jgi:hypothetical protein